VEKLHADEEIECDERELDAEADLLRAVNVCAADEFLFWRLG
jgi:hypothetical protein